MLIRGLFTRMSIEPRARTAWSMSWLHWDSLVVSAAIASDRRPSPRISSRADSISSRVRLLTTTSAPAAASATAMVRPSPRPAPATTATRPSRLKRPVPRSSGRSIRAVYRRAARGAARSLVPERFGDRRPRSTSSGQERHDHGRAHGDPGDDNQVDPRDREVDVPRLLAEVAAGEKHPGQRQAQREPQEDARKSDEPRFEEEAQCDHAPLVADGPEHADLLSPFDHGPGGDHAECRDTNDEAKAHEPLEHQEEPGLQPLLLIEEGLERVGGGLDQRCFDHPSICILIGPWC